MRNSWHLQETAWSRERSPGEFRETLNSEARWVPMTLQSGPVGPEAGPMPEHENILALLH